MWGSYIIIKYFYFENNLIFCPVVFPVDGIAGPIQVPSETQTSPSKWQYVIERSFSLMHRSRFPEGLIKFSDWIRDRTDDKISHDTISYLEFLSKIKARSRTRDFLNL